MTLAYFDCFSGVSGDMILGALVDAGCPFSLLKRKLAKLPIDGYRLLRARGEDFDGTNLHVEVMRESRQQRYVQIDAVLARSRLDRAEKDLAREIFLRLATAEARVHRMPLKHVHFHELGTVDALVDIVGAAIACTQFGFAGVHASPLPMSRGKVRCAHGTLPVPAPATLELLKQVPLERTTIKGEMVTPTGAAILTTIVQNFGECPLQRVERVGVGFGDRKLPGRANILRLMIGEGFPAVVIETDIDDMNPELFEPVMKALFDAGASDVTLQPIQMKKGRPAVRLGCVSPWEWKDRIIDCILKETTTFGVRYWPAERKMLVRKLVTKSVKRGKIRYKVGMDEKGNILKAIPEFEDVKKLAARLRRPLWDVYREVCASAC